MSLIKIILVLKGSLIYENCKRRKIDRVFLIKNYEVKSKKNGGNYLDMTLLDKDN